ncbi:hypothetical protein CYMTET_51156 [Cymbomonas tetramitiformis]|uniref:Uncharacterized protein n=1 Tax=Cymbomonas tetramitiformis TaxID=36881 RepID=A0AAE0BLS4_9CHLO|nr:hypothetical protein CYMTET_51156 [Cymbomonas tetramitiformis]
MSHVLGPVSRDEVYKLLDLDFEYDAHHYVVNALIYAVLPTVLRGMALPLYDAESTRVHPHDGRCALHQRLRFHVEGIGDPDTHRFWVRLRATKIDETLEPAPQLAVVRTLADKHRRLHPEYSDRDPVEDAYAILRSSASASPYITPLHLVVLRELGTAHGHTFASLALRLGSVYNLGRRKYDPPEGKWKKHGGGGRCLVLEGTGMPCITCFRLWAVTTGHMDTDGICPYAHAHRELELPPQDETAQPAVMTVHLRTATSSSPLVGSQALPVCPVPMTHGSCDPQISALAIRPHMDDETEDWPAFRDSPVYLPPKPAGNA